ncbi:MAG: hypothetical protein K0R67_2509 [Paenibacillus sp.]|nr:hypothetical protein [Paenibacillus sp.]
MRTLRTSFAGFLIFVLLLGGLQAGSPSVHADYNDISLALANSGFEEPQPNTAIPGWSMSYNGGLASTTTEKAYKGAKSLKLVDASITSAVGLESDKISAETGSVYTAYANLFLNGTEAQIYVRFWDSNNNILGSSNSVSTNNGAWHEVKVQSTAPVGTRYVSALLYTSSAATGTAFFDEAGISVERDMLINNYSFEKYIGSSPSSWELIHNGGTATVSTDRAFTGTHSLKMVDNRTDKALSMQSSKLAAVENETYTLQARVFVNDGQGAQLYMKFWDSSLNYIDSSPFVNTGRSTGDWKSLSISGTAPANTSYVTVMLYIPAATTGTVYFDDVQISKRITQLGPQMTSTIVHGAAFGYDENQKPVLYVVTDGSGATPPRLAVIDYNTNHIDRIVDVDAPSGGTSPAWAVTFSSDGKVYMGLLNMTNGALYRYNPGDAFVESLGVPDPGSKLIWDVKSGANGEIYVGTSANATLYKYVYGTGYSVVGAAPLQTNETFVRSVAYDPVYNAVFAGIGTHAYLKRHDFDTGQTIEILPSSYQSEAYVYDLQYRDSKLFARMSPSSNQLVFDVTEDLNGDVQVALDSVIPNFTSLGLTSSLNDEVYYTSDRIVQSYNMVTKTANSLNAELPVNPIEMEIAQLDDQLQYPGYTVVGLGSNAGQLMLVKYNLQDNEVHTVELSLPEANTSINSVAVGPDGRIYTGGFLNGGLGAYTPLRSDLTEQYKAVGQAEGMYSFNNRLYLGVYPLGRIYEYDPSQPWTLNTGGSNPKLLYTTGDEQDRPYALASGGSKLFAGTIPKAGAVGGALTIYDTALGGSPTVIRNIVQDQSVTALTYKDGVVYGGTSIWGGAGTTPTASSAAFFAYDVSSGQKTLEIVPVVGKKAITALMVGPDGNIWGLAEGNLFIYSPSQQQIIYNQLKFSNVSYTGATYSDATMLMGKDGNIYLKIRNAMHKINPATKAVTNISVGTNIRGLAQDDFGNMYFYWQENLYRYSF